MPPAGVPAGPSLHGLGNVQRRAGRCASARIAAQVWLFRPRSPVDTSDCAVHRPGGAVYPWFGETRLGCRLGRLVVMMLRQTSGLEAQARALALRLVGLDRYSKRVILATNDFALLNLALWCAMSVRLGEFFVPLSWTLFVVLGAAPFIGVATFFQLNVYRMVTRFLGWQGAVTSMAAVSLSALYWCFLVYL